jgi:hypothetical protein
MKGAAKRFGVIWGGERRLGNELLPKGKEGKQKETPISPLASPSLAWRVNLVSGVVLLES